MIGSHSIPPYIPPPASIQRSNCYMVWGADAAGSSAAGRASSDLEVGCLIDLASGFVSFTANGKELPTVFQVTCSHTHA